MTDQAKLQDQRETWLRAKAATVERTRERDEGVKRLEATLERAQNREAEEHDTLARMVIAAKESADKFLAPADEAENKRAAEALARTNKTADESRRAAEFQYPDRAKAEPGDAAVGKETSTFDSFGVREPQPGDDGPRPV